MNLYPAIGSPPLARGRLEACKDLPANVAHPRLRGEDCIFVSQQHWFWGSPPLARGRPLYTSTRPSNLRLTPACAGKTTTYLLGQNAIEAHPRLRGEDPISLPSVSSVVGSPPLARGRRYQNVIALVKSRLTPACAGKTLPLPNLSMSPQAHPRLRGEDPVAVILVEPS